MLSDVAHTMLVTSYIVTSSDVVHDIMVTSYMNMSSDVAHYIVASNMNTYGYVIRCSECYCGDIIYEYVI